jgi:hypothetical protein
MPVIRERRSSKELAMDYDSFKALGFKRVCKMLGLA